MEEVMKMIRGGCRLFLFATRALDQRLKTLQDFLAIEWLDQVVVGADLQSRQPVLHVALAGNQDHADIAGALDGFERLADFPATLLGHQDVQENDLRDLFLGDPQSLFAVARGQNPAVERSEVDPEQIDYAGIVIGDQNRGSGGHTVGPDYAPTGPVLCNSRGCSSRA